jgi:hypothetical protein
VVVLNLQVISRSVSASDFSLIQVKSAKMTQKIMPLRQQAGIFALPLCRTGFGGHPDGKVGEIASGTPGYGGVIHASFDVIQVGRVFKCQYGLRLVFSLLWSTFLSASCETMSRVTLTWFLMPPLATVAM